MTIEDFVPEGDAGTTIWGTEFVHNEIGHRLNRVSFRFSCVPFRDGFIFAIRPSGFTRRYCLGPFQGPAVGVNCSIEFRIAYEIIFNSPLRFSGKNVRLIILSPKGMKAIASGDGQMTFEVAGVNPSVTDIPRR